MMIPTPQMILTRENAEVEEVTLTEMVQGFATPFATATLLLAAK